MKKISIIVPVYNSEDYLPSCLDSLLNQTYKNIEIIIIDDGSKDNSLRISKQAAKNDDRIILHSIKNSGVSTARNIGIASSTGDYITFVDSDDWIELNMIEFVVGKLNENNADIIIWSFFKNYPDKEILLSLIPGGDQSFTNDKELLYLKSIDQYYDEKTLNGAVSVGTTWCKLYKSELIKQNKIKFKNKLTRAQDVVFSLEAFQKAEVIKYYDENLYHYRINDSSITSGTKFILNTEEPFNLLLEEIIDFSNQFTDNEEFRRAMNTRTIKVLLWHLNHKYFHKEYKVNILKRKKEVSKLIKTEPYQTALKDINIDDILPKKEKIMAKFFKRNLIVTFYLVYTLHQIYVKFNEKKNSFKN